MIKEFRNHSMIDIKEGYITEFDNSKEWRNVMKPLLENQIELVENKMEGAVLPHDTHALKETWTTLRRLIAIIDIYNEE